MSIFRASIVIEELTTSVRESAPASVDCFHCGNKCSSTRMDAHHRTFCCQGCLAVFETLTDSGVSD